MRLREEWGRRTRCPFVGVEADLCHAVHNNDKGEYGHGGTD
jgi:hypothetical protein